MLDKNSPIPLHIQLIHMLRSQILRKDLLPGSRLPSERELCEQYGISRITVRQALAALVQPEDADLLGLARPAAVLVSEQTTFLDSGGVIEITRSLFHAERYKLYTQS